MGLLAIITRVPEIKLTEWMHYISSNPALVRAPDREIDNPLKQGVKTIIRPMEGEVHIMVNDRWIGTVVPGEEYDHPGTLTVYASSEHAAAVKEFMKSVVEGLNANMECYEEPD